MNSDFVFGISLGLNIVFIFKFSRIIVTDKLRFKKGFKAGYDMGLNHVNMAHSELMDTKDGIEANLYLRIYAHYPQELK